MPDDHGAERREQEADAARRSPPAPRRGPARARRSRSGRTTPAVRTHADARGCPAAARPPRAAPAAGVARSTAREPTHGRRGGGQGDDHGSRDGQGRATRRSRRVGGSREPPAPSGSTSPTSAPASTPVAAPTSATAVAPRTTAGRNDPGVGAQQPQHRDLAEPAGDHGVHAVGDDHRGDVDRDRDEHRRRPTERTAPIASWPPAARASTVSRSLPHAGRWRRGRRCPRDQADGADLAPEPSTSALGLHADAGLEADEQLGDLLGRHRRRGRRPAGRRRAPGPGRRSDAATGSWLTITMVWPYSRTAVRSSPSTSRELRVSRLPVGSSARTTAGRGASARAMATRCCCPPDSSPGRCVGRSARPSTSSRWSTQARSSAVEPAAGELEGQQHVLARRRGSAPG